MGQGSASGTTSYDVVYDVFYSSIEDPVVDEMSDEVRNGMCLAYLMYAITRFRLCRVSLDARDDQAGVFHVTLSEDEKQILGALMVIRYLEQKINYVGNFRQVMSTRDFQISSQANFLRAMETSLVYRKKAVSQMIVDYSYQTGLLANQLVK